MGTANDIDFEWAGIAFRLLRRGDGADRFIAPVMLQWRRPSGESGSRGFPDVPAAMLHSARMTDAEMARRHGGSGVAA